MYLHTYTSQKVHRSTNQRTFWLANIFLTSILIRINCELHIAFAIIFFSTHIACTPSPHVYHRPYRVTVQHPSKRSTIALRMNIKDDDIDSVGPCLEVTPDKPPGLMGASRTRGRKG